MNTPRTKSAYAVAARGAVPASLALRWKITVSELEQCDYRVAVMMYDAMHSRRDSLNVLHWMHSRCCITRGYQFLACMDAFGMVISSRELAFFYDIFVDDEYPDDVKRWRLQALPDFCLPMRCCSMEGDDYDDVLDAFYEYWGG